LEVLETALSAFKRKFILKRDVCLFVSDSRKGNIQLITNAKAFWHIAIEIMMS